MSSLRRFAFPRIGKMPVSEVTSADVLEILSPIWHRKAQTARRLRQRLRAVLEWAVAMEFRMDNPCDRIGPVPGPQHDEGFPHLLGRVRPAHSLHRPDGGLFEYTIDCPLLRGPGRREDASPESLRLRRTSPVSMPPGDGAPGAQRQGQVPSSLSSWPNRALPGLEPMDSPPGFPRGCRHSLPGLKGPLRADRGVFPGHEGQVTASGTRG